MENDNAILSKPPTVEPNTSDWRQSGLLHCILVGVFIVVADVLFYRQPVGWTLGAYGLLLLLAVGLCHKPDRPWSPERD